MADDLREFIDEHFRRFDEKLDRLIGVLVELQTTQAGGRISPPWTTATWAPTSASSA
jgi:hypothetical protein